MWIAIKRGDLKARCLQNHCVKLKIDKLPKLPVIDHCSAAVKLKVIITVVLCAAVRAADRGQV